MKKIRWRDLKESMRKGVHSLTWKWTIGAAIAIFFTYSMFTVAIYQGFTNMMMAQEHTNVNDTLLSIIEKLKMVLTI